MVPPTPPSRHRPPEPSTGIPSPSPRALSQPPSSPVGTYPIVPVATGTNLADYTVVYSNGTLTVGQATLTVTAGNATRTYGAANPTFSASATGAVNGDTFTFTESTIATTASPVGTYPIVPVATGTNLADYTVVYNNGTLTVGQATLTVTAGNATRTYGAANPTFSASATGTVNGDTFTFTESTIATPCVSGRHLPDRSGGDGHKPGRLHRGLQQRHPHHRPGYPDRNRRQRHPHLWRGQPYLLGIGHWSRQRGYLHLHRKHYRNHPRLRSAPTRSFLSRPAPIWPTTPWSKSTAPSPSARPS